MIVAVSPRHHPRGPLVLRDPEQLRILRHDGVSEVRQALARDDVLIDADVPEIGEALLVSRIVHDPVVLRRRAPHEEVAEDRGTGRGPTDDSASLEHVAEGFLRFGPAVVLHQMELPSALEPHAAAFLITATNESESAIFRSFVNRTWTFFAPAVFHPRVPGPSWLYESAPPAFGTSMISASGPPAASMNLA